MNSYQTNPDGNVAIICYIIFTPVQLLAAALLEPVLDRPGKNFANDLIRLLQKKDSIKEFLNKNKYRLLVAVLWFVIAWLVVFIYDEVK